MTTLQKNKKVYYFKGTRSPNVGRWIKCISVMGKTDEEVCLAMAEKGYEVKMVEYQGKKV